MILSRCIYVYLLVGFFVLCLNAGASQGSQDGNHGEGSANFIRSLAQKAIGSLTDADVLRVERIDRFRALFSDSFAVRSIGKRALGRYWRKTGSEERMEYQKHFEQLMVVAYVDRFANYAGESLTIRESRIEDSAIATVFTEIHRRDGKKPILVDWVVGTNGTVFKIVDVKVEGVSMTTTLRSEFSSIIRRRNGKVSGLIEELAKRTAQLSNNRN